MRTIHLQSALPDSVVDGYAGEFLSESHFDYDKLITGEDADVHKPDGSLLLRYRKDVLPRNVLVPAWSVLRHVETRSMNRGLAAGKSVNYQVDGRDAKRASATRFNPVLLDGTMSKTMYANPSESGIIGYFDRSQRQPYCRMTAFNIDHHREFEIALPFIYAISEAFRQHYPERYKAQMDVVGKTEPYYIIRNTVFTTITVNRNFRTACHKDKGDLSAGFGVMSVLEAGSYSGCYLIFPKYRTAVDMRTGGLCLADVHEWHGNSPLVGREGGYERVSVVCYYRAKMIECGSPMEELERVQLARGGLVTAEGDEETISMTPESGEAESPIQLALGGIE